MKVAAFLTAILASTAAQARSTQPVPPQGAQGSPAATGAAEPPGAPATTGVWTNVTPANADLAHSLDCQNFGTESMQADTANPGTLYTEFNCQGIWKSTDYGATWRGPINTGSKGATVGDCAGGITVSPRPGAPATVYESCIRGGASNAVGFWKSVDGGVNWKRFALSPLPSDRQDVYPPVVDPYDSNHLLMAGHEQNFIIESVNGGRTWSNVPMNAGMLQAGGTGAIFFINTGAAAATRGTWLWMAQQNGGTIGTWRTEDKGATWAKVDKNEHSHGSEQIFQPDNDGVVYMPGAYSEHGWGVLRSTDYGQTWEHVGGTGNETVVVGTSKNVYAMFGFPIGIGGTNNPSFEVAPQPGTGVWTAMSTPPALSQGTGWIAVVNDGTHNILVSASWISGVWRYVEP